MAQERKISIVIVDDHPSYSKGLSMLLTAADESIEVVATAKNQQEALEAIERHLPDLALVDIHLPGADGIEVTKLIRDLFPVVRVAMLTVSDEDRHVGEAMRLGASGFLIKDMEIDEIVSAIRAIHDGQVVVSPSVADKLLSGPSPEESLTDTEREILKMLANGLDAGEIAIVMSMSESGLKRNIRNILEKLHVETRIQAAVVAAKKGLI